MVGGYDAGVTVQPPRPKNGYSSTPPATVAPTFEDETFEQDDFEDDGVSRGGTAQMSEGKTEWPRPNGSVYHPRYLGSYQDCEMLRYARSRKEHTYYYGPPGTGKGALVEAAFFQDAETIRDDDGEFLRAHNGMYTIVCDVDVTAADFVGTYVQDPYTGTFQWVHGPLTMAVIDDVPLFVDEILLADTRVLAPLLYPLMDGRNMLQVTSNPSLPPFPVGPGFCVVGAGNPDVPGAHFSEALRDRFDHHVEILTDWSLARSLGVPAWVVRVAKELDEERADGLISWSPQMRSLLSFRNQAEQYGTDYAVSALIGKAPEQDRDHIVAALRARPEVTSRKPRPLRLGGRKPGSL